MVTLECDGGCVRAIYVITNPDKLAHIPAIAELE